MLLNLRRLALPEDSDTATLSAMAFSETPLDPELQNTLLSAGSITMNDAMTTDRLQLKELGSKDVEEHDQIMTIPTEISGSATV